MIGKTKNKMGNKIRKKDLEEPINKLYVRQQLGHEIKAMMKTVDPNSDIYQQLSQHYETTYRLLQYNSVINRMPDQDLHLTPVHPHDPKTHYQDHPPQNYRH